MVDARAVEESRAVEEYCALIGERELPSAVFEVIGMEDRFPVARINALLNEKE